MEVKHTELVYKQAGYLHLYRYRDGAEFVSPSFVTSISATVTKNSQTVTDGNSDFDEVFPNGMAGSVTINMNSFEPTFWGAALSAKVNTNESVRMMRIEEIYVPEQAPYTVTLEGTPVAGTDRVLTTNNQALTRVDDAPVQGEYSIANGTLTFSADDAGTYLKVIYEEDVQSATTVGLAPKATDDVFRITVVGKASLKENTGVVKTDNLVIDRATVTGDVNLPERQKEVQGHSLTFNVLKPRPGRDPVYYAVTN